MIEPGYSVRILGRGEDMVYRDHEGEVLLQRTYIDGHRLYCDDTSGDGFGPALALDRRWRIFMNLAEFFGTRERETIFVLGARDKDRQELQRLFGQLAEAGHHVRVETNP